MSDQTQENTPAQEVSTSVSDPVSKSPDHTKSEQKKPSDKGSNKPSKTRGSGLAVFIAVLALLCVGGVAYYGYMELEKFKSSLLEQKKSLADISEHTTFVKFKQQLSARLDKFQDEYHTSQKHIKALESLVSETASAATRDQEGWILSETQYLLNMANSRLRLLRDVSTATEALKGADQRLATLNNPSYLPVRETLAKEITALEMVSEPDVYGIVLKLSQLSEWVNRLPPSKVILSELDLEKQQEELGEFNYLNQIGRWFRDDFFGLKKKGTPYFNLDKNQEIFYLDQLIKLEIEAAKHAVLRFDQSSYQTHLQKAFEIVDEKYDSSSQKVSNVLSTLHELRGDVVFPELPNISYSSLQLSRIRSEYKGNGE